MAKALKKARRLGKQARNVSQTFDGKVFPGAGAMYRQRKNELANARAEYKADKKLSGKRSQRKAGKLLSMTSMAEWQIILAYMQPGFEYDFEELARVCEWCRDHRMHTRIEAFSRIQVFYSKGLVGSQRGVFRYWLTAEGAQWAEAVKVYPNTALQTHARWLHYGKQFEWDPIATISYMASSRYGVQRYTVPDRLRSLPDEVFEGLEDYVGYREPESSEAA